MRQLAPKLYLALLTALVLVACGGGGGGGGGGSNPPVNAAPTANAGPNQTVTGGAPVTLNGSASTDSDGTIATYAWTQTAGTNVTLTGAATAQPTFVAPQVLATTVLTFSLVVTDNRFTASAAATVNITVNPSPNVLPTANAGDNQSTTSGFTVLLNGAASADSDGSIAEYVWLQTAGTAVTLTGATTAQATFVAPSVGAPTTFTFSLVVTDNRGGDSAVDTVDVVVNPPATGTSNITGTVTFARISILPNGASAGLNYGAQVQQPARGVVVQAFNTTTQQAVATATTSATGTYTLNVANSQQIRIEVVAEMARTGSLPTWRFRVQPAVNASVYVYTDNVIFDSTAAGTRNVAIPSGINASGIATGARASAPFAILDTVYQGVQTIVGVAPTANLPLLILDWAPTNVGGETFFTSDPVQHIVLSGDLADDTDEFDQHVIAHEFGHYIEFNFSRADSIGGGHSLGDKLDIRTAFGEGFGYAFAAMVLNDPVARDTFKENGNGRTSEFNVETNPTTNFPGTPVAENYGCWCSESSVWSILWDIYDSNADTNDSLALGFAPIWAVLTGAQKNTPAFTSIFSFITALKAQNPSADTAINTLVNAQNINAAGISAFGTSETHFPSKVQQNGALPVYTNAIVNGGPVIVRSVNDAGFYNGLGNHRFVRFTVPNNSPSVTITVTTSNSALDADPDFLIYRDGALRGSGESSAVGTEIRTISLPAAADYLLDVYDCGNVCSDQDGEPLGTPGDYNLTVTITQ